MRGPRQPHHVRIQAALVRRHIARLARVGFRRDIAPLELARREPRGARGRGEFSCVLLEQRHGVQREIAVFGELVRAPRNDHRRERLVRLQPRLAQAAWNRDKQRREVFAGRDEVGFLQQRGEGAR